MNLSEKFWESTYKKSIGKLIGTCYRYVNDKQLAEDLAHDAFITAINKGNTYTGKGNFDAWLRRVVVNTALMHLRKQHANVYADDLTMHEDKLMEKLDDENDKGLIEIADFSKEDLLQTVSLLPEHHRIVFNLYVIDGYTHQQIGDELGISPGTSKSHLARARKKLQQILNEKAQEKQQIKDWKRALIVLIFPGKAKGIDAIYQQKFTAFKLVSKKTFTVKGLALSKAAVPIAKTALITGKSAAIVTAAIIGGSGTVYIVKDKQDTPIKTESVIYIDDNITLNEPNDTIELLKIPETYSVDSTSPNLITKKSTPVVIKKQRIKRNPVVIKKAVIINDSTHAQ